jgi:carbamoyltransferase
MIIWGISALSHDASISVIKNDIIMFAAHSERYSKIKNDKFLNDAIIEDALRHGEPDVVMWYENAALKNMRLIFTGEYEHTGFIQPKTYVRSMLRSKCSKKYQFRYTNHHMSHVAASFYTSTFNDAVAVCVDAIGEFNTSSIWNCDVELKRVFSINYPSSIGLMYSAVTQFCGLKPNEEEYILMGMSAYGNSSVYYDLLRSKMFGKTESLLAPMIVNSHLGIDICCIDKDDAQQIYDIAAAAQRLVEEYMIELVNKALSLSTSKNLILCGGVALNCVANNIISSKFADKINNLWIFPNPGDSGSSLGAALLYARNKVEFNNAYLGHEITNDIKITDVVDELIKNKMCGIVRGRAEFGPRAFGNRSLIADPRGDDIKDLVNSIKKRQKFRPFAPIVLDKYASTYFDISDNVDYSYMQYVVKCKCPELLPAICHVDGTSRVQILKYDANPWLYNLIEEFMNRTGCPVILNTSLNVKGQPLVNDAEDAEAFSNCYNVKVFY